jgi:hypothetical protein
MAPWESGQREVHEIIQPLEAGRLDPSPGFLLGCSTPGDNGHQPGSNNDSITNSTGPDQRTPSDKSQAMPLELQLIRASEFVRLSADGHFDLETSKVALATIARACRKRGIERALLDLRALRPGLKPVFSPRDLASLVNTFHEIGFTRKQRLAVLYTSDPHGRARMFSFISTIHGWQVRGFASFEDAIFWLSEEQAQEICPPSNYLKPSRARVHPLQTKLRS